jgi:hypothetical protein
MVKNFATTDFFFYFLSEYKKNKNHRHFRHHHSSSLTQKGKTLATRSSVSLALDRSVMPTGFALLRDFRWR